MRKRQTEIEELPEIRMKIRRSVVTVLVSKGRRKKPKLSMMCLVRVFELWKELKLKMGLGCGYMPRKLNGRRVKGES